MCACHTADVRSCFALSAAEITVDIVSFMTGSNADLRSSELLMAKVTGYDGNTSHLTYKWTNNLGSVSNPVVEHVLRHLFIRFQRP